MKFSVGEIAIVIADTSNPPEMVFDCSFLIGQEVRITNHKPNYADYVARARNGILYEFKESELKKKPPKEYPLGADICNDICRKTPIREEA